MKKMLRLVISALICCIAVMVSSMTLFAEMRNFVPVPFSADWTIFEDDQLLGKGMLYAGLQGIRQEGTSGGESYAIIYNSNRQVAWHVIDSARIYFEMKISFDQFQLEMDSFDFGAPCTPDAQAERVGSDTLNGRVAEKWTCDVPDEGIEVVWYDPRLQTVICSENEYGRYEMTNIKEGPQPAELFVPPPDYKKMDITTEGSS
jgi:hypothetical protein